MHDMDMEDISNAFFDMVSRMTNMRYLKSRQISHKHCEEKREVNRVLHDSCGLIEDSNSVDMEEASLRKDVVQGIAKGLFLEGVVGAIDVDATIQVPTSSTRVGQGTWIDGGGGSWSNNYVVASTSYNGDNVATACVPMYILVRG
jgi:hypothetical protein